MHLPLLRLPLLLTQNLSASDAPRHLLATVCRGIARCRVLLPLVALLLLADPAFAQVDRVYPFTGNPVVGKITEMRPDGVVIGSGSNQQTVTVDKIRRILYDGDPAGLTKGREFALDGEYEQAVEELRRLDFSTLRRDAVKADAMYYLARSEAELALVGRGDTGDAIRKMLAFVRANPQNIHFYSAAKTLGRLAVATGNFDQALKYYGALSAAPVPELKIEAEYLIGVAKLRQGNAAEAQSHFANVAGASVQSASGNRLQTLAKAGQAMTLAAQSQGDEALQLVNELIAQLDPADSEMAARIYNAQGAGYEAKGDQEGAVMAYLHTHLMFSGQADAHAEALSRLIELWPQVGSPERANEARLELQQRYPGWKK